MSILNAKKIADLKHEIDVKTKVYSVLHDAARKSINDDLVSGFSSFMESHGFDVRGSAPAVTASYKGLSVQLNLAKPEDRFMGVYHSFELVVSNKIYFVRVIPEWNVGASANTSPGETIESLQQHLKNIEVEIENRKLVSYSLSFNSEGDDKTARNRRSSTPDVKVENVAELLDKVVS